MFSLGTSNPPLLERNPRVNYSKSIHPFVVCRFIFECCKKLEFSVLSTATAASLFHAFYKSSKSKEHYDPYLIAGSCVYLSGKVEDEAEMRLRDVINVVHATLHPEKEILSHDSEYFMHREALVEAELLLLRVVDFKVKFSHPHKYLLHYLKTLKDWINPNTWSSVPIASTAWRLLQDFYHDPFLLEYGESRVALSCVHLSLQIYGVAVDLMNDDQDWIKVFNGNVGINDITTISSRIMKVYSEDDRLIRPLLLAE